MLIRLRKNSPSAGQLMVFWQNRNTRLKRLRGSHTLGYVKVITSPRVWLWSHSTELIRSIVYSLDFEYTIYFTGEQWRIQGGG